LESSEALSSSHISTADLAATEPQRLLFKFLEKLANDDTVMDSWQHFISLDECVDTLPLVWRSGTPPWSFEYERDSLNINISAAMPETKSYGSLFVA
jgi:hypothetical protein